MNSLLLDILRIRQESRMKRQEKIKIVGEWVVRNKVNRKKDIDMSKKVITMKDSTEKT